jgi:hypothetical protein
MLAPPELDEYLDEIREQVCSHCVERPEGGPPCAPLGKVCGIELHLPQLIESIHEVRSDLIDPYLEHNRQGICEHCSSLNTSICPCPMDYLAVLLVQAVETVDQRRGWKPAEPVPEVALPETDPTPLERIVRAYEAGRRTWVGCDWPTRFGRTGLNLNGWTADEARSLAGGPVGTEEDMDWEEAAEWLARLESHARWAEKQASLAVAAANAGRWPEALQRARWALAVELSTGRSVRRAEPPTWEALFRAVKAAADTQARSEEEPAPRFALPSTWGEGG